MQPLWCNFFTYKIFLPIKKRKKFCPCDFKWINININLPFFQLTFFFNPDWSTYVCGADEIRDYQKSIVTKFGLHGHISFNTGVKKATWDEISSKWTIETDTNETFQVTHLISGCGVLRTPHIPNFKGPENSIHFFEYVLWWVKLIYSEKVTLFCEIFTNYLSYV